jgi:hypothetical protein
MPTMLPRVIALLLAFVMLWSGVSTIEAPRALEPTSSEQQHAAAHIDGQGTVHEGSVDDHHLDDLPAQAQTDSLTETPDVLLALPLRRFHDESLAQPRSPAAVASAPPFLVGPLRPPCFATFTG